MTDTTKPKSGGDLEIEAMQVDEDERLPQEVTTPTTNAVDNSGFAVWCKDNGLSDQVVEALWGAGFRTPKDLIDRKSDLKKLNLEIDDYMIIGGAIERMRNASASNSVDNAALAHGDAPTGVQRVDELDEQIRKAFKNYRDENKLEWQRKNVPVGLLLRNAVPRNAFAEEFDLIASSFDSYRGDVYDKLCKVVKRNFYGSDAHEGQSTAIIQAFGCGKSRAALQLAKDYVVLPLHVIDNELVRTLINAQKELFAGLEKLIKNKREPTITKIRNFSDSCLRLVHLVLFALQALHKHCENLGVVHSEAGDRHDLAVLLQFRAQPLVNWTVGYFTRRMDEILGMSDAEFKKEIGEAATYGSQRRVIFLFDEAHAIMSSCRGYCLHKDKEPPEPDDKLVQKWLRELKSSDGSVTNLLYQFRRVSREYLEKVTNCNGFVMCSTAFKLWNAALTLPSTRGETKRFSKLHWFTDDDIQLLIKHYFTVDGELFTEQRMQTLRKFRRPVFMAALITELVNCSIASGVERWFDSSLKSAMTSAEELLEHQVTRLMETANELVVDGNSSSHLVHLVYIMNKLCGGKLDLDLENERTFVELINCGVVRLVKSRSREVVCDDPLFIETVDKVIERMMREERRDVVTTELLSPLIVNLNGDKALKGKVGERIIAWLALCDGLELITDKQPFTFCPHMQRVCRAGTADQLLQKRSLKLDNEPDLILRVMMDPSFPWVLFPSNQCGPDILFRQRNGGARIVVVQCKMNKSVMALAEFNEALLTLDPTCYFKSPRNAKVEVHKSDDRKSWLTHAEQLKDFAFQRIVFEPLGFSPHVQYLVREYNDAQKNSTSTTFIHLLTLNDIKEQVSELNYQRMINLVKGDSASVKVIVHQEFMLQSEWMSRDRDQDHKLPIDVLKKMCDARDINVTWTPEDIQKKAKTDKKPYEAKTEAELIDFLDEYKVDEKLAELKWDLS